MNLRSMEYFLATAETGSVTRAAERLHISQQALSSHIQRLEEEYQVRLFERKPVFRLTQAGEQMVYYARRILQDEAGMRSSFSDLSRNARATLRVGCPRLRSRVFFPLIWRFYHPLHPNISVELVDGSGAELSEQLSLGRLDLFIAVNVPPVPNQERIPLASEPVCCLFSESLLRESCPGGAGAAEKMLRGFAEHGADLDVLAGIPGLWFLSTRPGNRLREAVDLSLSRDRRLNYLLECNDQELLYQMAQEGAGVGLLSPVILYQHHRDPEFPGAGMRHFPFGSGVPQAGITLVCRRDYARPGYMEDFIEDTRTVFRSYDHSMRRRARP